VSGVDISERIPFGALSFFTYYGGLIKQRHPSRQKFSG